MSETAAVKKVSKFFAHMPYALVQRSGFPHSFLEPLRLTLSANDTLYETGIKGGMYARRIGAELGPDAAEPLLKKSLVTRAVGAQVTSIFLFRKMTGKAKSAVYIPSDPRLAKAVYETGAIKSFSGGALPVPRWVSSLGFAQALANVAILNSYLLIFILTSCFKRGISLTTTPWRVALALKTYGTHVSKELVHQRSFLGMSIDELNREAENRLVILFQQGVEKEAADYLRARSINYVDLGREKVPFHLLAAALLKLLALGLDSVKFVFSGKPHAFHKAYVGALKDIFLAKVNLARIYPKALVEQTDYTTDGIVTTELVNRHGGKVFSAMHGNYWLRWYAFWYLYYDYYAVWGSFHLDLHEPGWRYIKNKVITGGASQRKIESFMGRAKKSDHVPAIYADNFLLVAFPTIIETKAYIVEFFEALIDIVSRFPDIYVIVAPSPGFFDYCRDDRFQELKKTIASLDRIKIDEENDSYLHLAIADLALTQSFSSIGFESLAYMKKTLFYDIENCDLPLEANHDAMLVARTRSSLFELIGNVKAGRWLSREDHEDLAGRFFNRNEGGWDGYLRLIKETAGI